MWKGRMLGDTGSVRPSDTGDRIMRTGKAMMEREATRRTCPWKVRMASNRIVDGNQT